MARQLPRVALFVAVAFASSLASRTPSAQQPPSADLLLVNLKDMKAELTLVKGKVVYRGPAFQ